MSQPDSRIDRRGLVRGGLALATVAGPASALGWGSSLSAGCGSTVAPLPAGTQRVHVSGSDWRVDAAPEPYAIASGCPGGRPFQRFEVRGQDQAPGDRGKAPRNRAEFSSLTRFPEDQEIWFAYSFRLRAGAPTTAAFCILGQFHSSPDPGDVRGLSPVFAINLIREGSVRFVSRASTSSVQRVNPEPEILGEVDGIVRERWVNLVGAIVFSHAGAGSVQLWMNGRQIIDRQRLAIGYGDLRGPYWKYGIYRAAAPETLVAEYANMEVGPGSLAERITRPMAV